MRGRRAGAAAIAFIAALTLTGCGGNEHELDPGTGQIAFLALPGRPDTPWAVPECRQALSSAIDRVAVADAFAATSIAGAQPATTLSPPTIASFETGYQPFPVGDGTGDVAVARTGLDACGAGPHPHLRLTWPRTEAGAGMAAAIIGSLARVNVAVIGLPVDATDYVSFVQSPSRLEAAGVDAALVQHTPLRPGVSGFWAPLVSGDLAGREPTTNTAGIDLPTVDALLVAPEIDGDQTQQADVGRMLDRLVLETGQLIPLAFEGRGYPD